MQPFPQSSMDLSVSSPDYLRPYERWWDALSDEDRYRRFPTNFSLPDTVRAYASFNPTESPYPELDPDTIIGENLPAVTPDTQPFYDLARLDDGLRYFSLYSNRLRTVGIDDKDGLLKGIFAYPQHMQILMPPKSDTEEYEMALGSQAFMDMSNQEMTQYLSTHKFPILGQFLRDLNQKEKVRFAPNIIDYRPATLDTIFVLSKVDWFGPSLSEDKVQRYNRDISTLDERCGARLYDQVMARTNFQSVIAEKEVTLSAIEFFEWTKSTAKFDSPEIRATILQNIPVFVPYRDLISLYLKTVNTPGNNVWAQVLDRIDKIRPPVETKDPSKVVIDISSLRPQLSASSFCRSRVGNQTKWNALELKEALRWDCYKLVAIDVLVQLLTSGERYVLEQMQDDWASKQWARAPINPTAPYIAADLVAFYAVAGHAYRFAPGLLLYLYPEAEPVVMSFWSEYGEAISFLQDLTLAFYTWWNALPNWRKQHPSYWYGTNPNESDEAVAFARMSGMVDAESTASLSTESVCENLASRMVDETTFNRLRQQLRRLQDTAVVENVPLSFIFATDPPVIPSYQSEVNVSLTPSQSSAFQYAQTLSGLKQLVIYSGQVIFRAKSKLRSSLWWFDSLRLWWDSICKSALDFRLQQVIQNEAFGDLGQEETQKADVVLKNALRSIAGGTSVGGALRGIQLAGRPSRAAYNVNPLEQDMQQRRPKLSRPYVQAVSNKLRAMIADKNVMRYLKLLYEGVMDGTTTELQADWDLQLIIDEFDQTGSVQ